MHLRENFCLNVSAPYGLSISTMTISTVFWIFTIPGNLLVILAVVIDPNRKLRSAFNWFVANLAAADLLVGGISEPVSTYMHYEESLGRLTPELYNLLHIPYFISTSASVFSLAALSWDRYIAITCPLEYRFVFSPKRTAFIIILIWLISIIIPPVIYLHVGYIRYTLIFINSTVALTFLILIFSYARIFQSFRGQIREWDRRNNTMEKSVTMTSLNRWETKATKTLLVMLLLFLACYAPASVLSYFMNFCDSCSCHTIHFIRDFNILIVMLSSGINPILYAWRLEPYREAFKKLLKCSCWRHYKRYKRIDGEDSSESSLDQRLIL